MVNKIKTITLISLLALTTTRETKTINWKTVGAAAGLGIAAFVL